MSTSEIVIEHNPARQRFEHSSDGQLGVAEYQMSNGVMLLTSTRVPEAIQGRGVASALIRTALDFAASEGLKVDPLCSFARTYMEQHPETRALHV